MSSAAPCRRTQHKIQTEPVYCLKEAYTNAALWGSCVRSERTERAVTGLKFCSELLGVNGPVGTGGIENVESIVD